jgi:hypothetical protein
MMNDSGKRIRIKVGLAYVLPTLSEEEPPRIYQAFVWVWILFLILVGLAVLAIWLFVPPWYIRLAGSETRGMLLQVQDCEIQDGDEGFLMLIRFRDTRGQLYELPPGDYCDSEHNNGDTLPLWYLPTDPTRALSYSDAIGVYIATSLLLIAVLVSGWLFLRNARSFIRICIRAEAPARLYPPALAALLVLALLVLVSRISKCRARKVA